MTFFWVESGIDSIWKHKKFPCLRHHLWAPPKKKRIYRLKGQAIPRGFLNQLKNPYPFDPQPCSLERFLEAAGVFLLSAHSMKQAELDQD